jgi:hypothetical protein
MTDSAADVDELNPIDKEALERAMRLIADDRTHGGQIADMLLDRPWRDVAKFAAYVCQTNRLALRPWQSPPCHANFVDGEWVARDLDAAALAARLAAVGLSRFEPNLPAALIEAEKPPLPLSPRTRSKRSPR